MSVADPAVSKFTGERYRTIPESILFSDVSDRAIRLYLVLDSYLGRNETAWPSRKTLSKDLRCSLDTIDRALKELVRAGAVSVEHRHHENGGFTSSDYHLGRSLAAPMRPPSLPDAATGRNTIEGSKKHMSNASVGRARPQEYSPDFEHLWSLYPRKSAKRTAWRKVQTLLRSGIAQKDLETAAKNYSRSVQGTEQRFIKHAATFYGPDEHWREWLDSPPEADSGPDPEIEHQLRHSEAIDPPKGLLASVRAMLGGT